MPTNRQIVLRRRPTGLVALGDTELISSPAPRPAEGEALLRTTYIGLDAAVRTWLNDQPGYLPPVGIGEVIRAAGVGEVVESRCPAYQVGDIVTTLTGFQEYSIIRDDIFSTPIPGESDQRAIMSVYGSGGATAYFGMKEVGRPQPGRRWWSRRRPEPPVPSPARSPGSPVPAWSASPAVPRSAVPWWRTSASTPASTTRTTICAPRSNSTAPKGVNVYYDNVGGEILDAVLGRLAPKARVVLCGVISSYLTGEHPGPANYVNLLSKTASMQGFNALEMWTASMRRSPTCAGGEPKGCWCTGRRSSTDSSRASMRSTDCSPEPTSARCW